MRRVIPCFLLMACTLEIDVPEIEIPPIQVEIPEFDNPCDELEHEEPEPVDAPKPGACLGPDTPWVGSCDELCAEHGLACQSVLVTEDECPYVGGTEIAWLGCDHERSGDEHVRCVCTED
jgi:hypothetical protein